MSFNGAVLHVRTYFGGHYSSETETRKYRYEQRTQKMRLIARDIESNWTDGVTQYQQWVSENWLARKIKHRTCEPIKSESGCPRWKYARLNTNRHKVYLDDGSLFDRKHTPSENPSEQANP